MSSEEKSIRVIEFSGKRSDWKIWSRKFLARANRKGYKALLEGKEAIPKVSEYSALAASSDADDKKGQALGIERSSVRGHFTVHKWDHKIRSNCIQSSG
jgi:hypothetical protein